MASSDQTGSALTLKLALPYNHITEDTNNLSKHLACWVTIPANDILKYFLLPENNDQHFLRRKFAGPDETSNFVFWETKKKFIDLTSTEFAQRSLKVLK